MDTFQYHCLVIHGVRRQAAMLGTIRVYVCQSQLWFGWSNRVDI